MKEVSPSSPSSSLHMEQLCVCCSLAVPSLNGFSVFIGQFGKPPICFGSGKEI